MSLGGDYVKLIDALWNQEMVNMWNPLCHATIAYIMDKTYGSFGYESRYEKWFKLIQSEDLNNFSWDIVNCVVEISADDCSIPEDDKVFFRKIRDTFRSPYEEGIFGTFGILPLDDAPKWFFEMFYTYMKLKENELQNVIIDYCKSQCHMSELSAKEAYKKLARYEDILQEIYFVIVHGRFKQFFPLTIYGHSAEELTQTTHLSILGAYNYLIYLREKPDEALKALKKDLPVK